MFCCQKHHVVHVLLTGHVNPQVPRHVGLVITHLAAPGGFLLRVWMERGSRSHRGCCWGLGPSGQTPAPRCRFGDSARCSGACPTAYEYWGLPLVVVEVVTNLTTEGFIAMCSSAGRAHRVRLSNLTINTRPPGSGCFSSCDFRVC